MIIDTKLALVLLTFALAACQTQISLDSSLSLEGGENFRDFGGYATVDGGQVRRGVLYRSNDLARFSGADYEQIADLNIQLVVDLRTSAEQAEAATRWLGARPRFMNPAIAAGMPGSNEDRRRTAGVQMPPAAAINGMMERWYGDLPTAAAGQFASLMEELSKPDSLPVLVHCTAGKDRTGVAAALILSLLGVPRHVVVADYLQSNEHPLAYYAQMPASAKPFMRVEASWLEATFASIEAEYGSVMDYLRDGLGVDEATLARIRAKLLH